MAGDDKRKRVLGKGVSYRAGAPWTLGQSGNLSIGSYLPSWDLVLGQQDALLEGGADGPIQQREAQFDRLSGQITGQLVTEAVDPGVASRDGLCPFVQAFGDRLPRGGDHDRGDWGCLVRLADNGQIAKL